MIKSIGHTEDSLIACDVAVCPTLKITLSVILLQFVIMGHNGCTSTWTAEYNTVLLNTVAGYISLVFLQ